MAQSTSTPSPPAPTSVPGSDSSSTSAAPGQPLHSCAKPQLTPDAHEPARTPDGAESAEESSAVASSGEAGQPAPEGSEGTRAAPKALNGAKQDTALTDTEQDARLTAGTTDRSERQEIVPKQKIARELVPGQAALGSAAYAPSTASPASGAGAGVGAQKSEGTRSKGFNIMNPPPGFDDPEPVRALDFTEEVEFPKAHCTVEHAARIRGARGGMPKGESSGYDDPDLVHSSPHPPAPNLKDEPSASRRHAPHSSAGGRARSMVAASGYNDPDLVSGRTSLSAGSANALGACAFDACGKAQAPPKATSRNDLHAGPPEEYQGACSDALPMVQEASLVLESHFCKLAETLAHERAALEKDRAAHRSLQQALRAAKVPVVCLCVRVCVIVRA